MKLDAKTAQKTLDKTRVLGHPKQKLAAFTPDSSVKRGTKTGSTNSNAQCSSGDTNFCAQSISDTALGRESARRMPAALADIRDEACAFEAHGDERAQTARQWAQQKDRLQQATPRIRVEDGGDTIRLGALSPGCRACKAGKWDCLFLSMSCNLSCAFCLTPCDLAEVSALSALGNDLDALGDIYASSDIAGIGFSGGEPLLTPHRLLHCLSRLRARRPDLYFWTYTNGLPLTTELLSALAEAGLNELRFNMAATGYSHSHVAAMLRQAVICLPCVTVEVPAIPEHAGPLRAALPVWSRIGVKHLNLHELIYEPGSPSETMHGARAHCRMPDGHVCAFNPHSSELVADVLRDIESGGLTLAVNYCSLASKARQLCGRRRMMAVHTLRAYERLREDGEAESVCYFNGNRYEFAPPATRADSNRHPAGFGVALVRRLLPLTREVSDQWTRFEVIQEAAES
jgi:pyruvate formate-lyase activating enzyme-like uncharacterized protein